MADTNTTKDTAGDDVLAWLDAAQGEEASKIGVWKLDPRTRKLVYLDNENMRGTPVEILNIIRARYGGGDFQLRAYGPKTKDHPGGSYGTVDFTVSGPGKPINVGELEEEKDTELDRERQRAAELERRLREVEKGREDDRVVNAIHGLGEYIREVRNPPPQAETAPIMPMFFELMKNFQSMVLAQVNRPAPAPAPPAGPSGVELIPVILSVLETGMGLGERAAAGQGEGFGSVAGRLVPTIERLVNHIAAPGAAPAGAAPGAPTSSELTTPEEAQPTMPTDVRSFLKPFVPTLLQWADAGSDPFIRADQTLEDLNSAPRWRRELGLWLQEQGGSAVTTLAGWYPELGQRREWCEAYLQGLREDLFGTDDSETDGEAAEVQ